MPAACFLGNAGYCKDNSGRYPAHPKGWMRRYWTVGPKQTKRSQRIERAAVAQGSDGSGSDSPGASRRCGGFRVFVRTAQPPCLRLMPAYGQQSVRRGRLDARGVPAALPQNRDVSERIRVLHVVAPHDRERGADAATQKSAPGILPGGATQADGGRRGPRKGGGAAELRVRGAGERGDLEPCIE